MKVLTYRFLPYFSFIKTSKCILSQFEGDREAHRLLLIVQNLNHFSVCQLENPSNFSFAKVVSYEITLRNSISRSHYKYAQRTLKDLIGQCSKVNNSADWPRAKFSAYSLCHYHPIKAGCHLAKFWLNANCKYLFNVNSLD